MSLPESGISLNDRLIFTLFELNKLLLLLSLLLLFRLLLLLEMLLEMFMMVLILMRINAKKAKGEKPFCTLTGGHFFAAALVTRK